ncbi:putative mannosyltransferase KNAG_0H01910 [Huiozyma naganishii CBS 8797]|uniref:Mannosyltransferase n=1 Tax=Huiozyma naganishii (strain ATCC MYA-139 / BCRC 22969 / CBS 8797 / KCTC 17520 / NBRC 10181 / NCYC 3082 / Yp74L-3) TaxID=1071383 RepID=J7R9R4_HUIN7|nr:hypothetical protein KNAG_0H01910 [Kazachstania naganishii CBS 8797]CCK71605.1 hypothetical protein KNAG_0H01910 [Kazachstania naganishii CBS 8797]
MVRLAGTRYIRYVVEEMNPLTACIVGAFFITVPFIIYTSKPSRDLSLLNSYQLTDTKVDSVFSSGCVDTRGYLADPMYKKQNATFVMLTRNSELDDVLSTMASVEEHFNQWFQYPYVFLNDMEFTEQFKNAVKEHTRANVTFDIIESADWEFPSNVPRELLHENIELQGDRGILYGSMESYHKMCRFYSGKFYHNKYVKQYEWYWRLEPSVQFFCDLSYDPFFEMKKHGKKYGFTIMIPELYWTIPNLFRTTLSYLREYNLTVGSLWKVFTSDNSVVSIDDKGDAYMDKLINYEHDTMARVSEKIAIQYFLEEGFTQDNDAGMQSLIDRARSPVPIVTDKFDNMEYNMCHFWSNFEIARVDVFNNPVYQGYFDYLEDHNGFWSERWGDAPVHSLGLSLILDVEDVHYFRDIGYKHSTLQHCPKNALNLYQFPYLEAEKKWARQGSRAYYDVPKPAGTGCRCSCPKEPRRETEDDHPYCLNQWLYYTHLEDPSEPRKPKFNLTELTGVIEKDFLRQHRPNY